MIDVIIDLINTKGLDGIHGEEIVLGITQRIYRNNSNGAIDYMPGVIKLNGEAVYAGIDDVKSLMLYHKTNSASLSLTPRSGYGDSRNSQDSIDCSLIAVWDTRKVHIESADMLILLRSRLPQIVAGVPNVHQVQILPTNGLLNSKLIFDSEYTFDKDYLLPLYIRFVQLNYKIEIKYDQQCMEKCINCSS